MKNRNFYRMMLICLTAILLLSTSALAIEARASEYLRSYSATLAKTRDGDLAISYNVYGTRKMDSIGVSRIEVQRYNGSRWTTEVVYTDDDLLDLQDSNAAHSSGQFIHVPESSGSYKVLVQVYAEDKDGSDSRVVTTVSIKI